jgi:hypothetical protein
MYALLSTVRMSVALYAPAPALIDERKHVVLKPGENI